MLLSASLLAGRSESPADTSTGSALVQSVMDPNTKRRLSDLDAVRSALEKHREDKGAFPVSQGFDGFPSTDGKSSPTWIEGLQPTYIEALPLDPGHRAKTPSQYLYKSDGKDFKLVTHSVADCSTIEEALAWSARSAAQVRAPQA